MIILNWDFDVLPITFDLNTRYPIVARALGLKAEYAREQKYLAYKLSMRTSCFVL